MSCQKRFIPFLQILQAILPSKSMAPYGICVRSFFNPIFAHRLTRDTYSYVRTQTCRDTHTLQRLASSNNNTYASSYSRIREFMHENNQVFDANSREEDGEDDIASGSGSPECTVASSPVAERASGLLQLDPVKLRMENTQLKKQLRIFRVRASFCVCACSNMCVHGLMTHTLKHVCLYLHWCWCIITGQSHEPTRSRDDALVFRKVAECFEDDITT